MAPTLIDVLLVAPAVFMLVKAAARLRGRHVSVSGDAPASEDVLLPREMRDALER